MRALASKRRIVDIASRYQEYQAGRERFIDQVYEPYIAASRQFIERTGDLTGKATSAWGNAPGGLGCELALEYQAGESRFIDSYVPNDEKRQVRLPHESAYRPQG